PLELWARWDPNGVPGTHRFLTRIWNIVQEYLAAEPIDLDQAKQDAINRTIHPMIKKVTEDIEENRYNTAIAATMECVNALYKLKSAGLGRHEMWQQALESVVACVAPFAPFIAEELWQQLGHSTSVHRDTWPKYNETYLVSETMTIAVQVNGKLRGTVDLPADSAEESVIEAAKANEKIKAHVEGKDIVKTIYVPGKILNIVVKN
ncbi:MAG TPA: class I tRNA ligase family protein, partial [Chroococcales cyanobacterium]